MVQIQQNMNFQRTKDLKLYSGNAESERRIAIKDPLKVWIKLDFYVFISFFKIHLVEFGVAYNFVSHLYRASSTRDTRNLLWLKTRKYASFTCDKQLF